MKLIDLFEQRKVFYSAIKIPNNTTKLDYEGVIVKGNFDCSNTQIKSLEGAPSEVDGDFLCYATIISSLEGAPHKVGKNLLCFDTRMPSLRNIHKQIKHIGDTLVLPHTLTSHVLGVMFIKGLQEVLFFGHEANEEQEQVAAIINKHLAGDHDPHTTQEELIDAGFSEYAKL